jgi:hypothetical protein
MKVAFSVGSVHKCFSCRSASGGRPSAEPAAQRRSTVERSVSGWRNTVSMSSLSASADARARCMATTRYSSGRPNCGRQGERQHQGPSADRGQVCVPTACAHVDRRNELTRRGRRDVEGAAKLPCNRHCRVTRLAAEGMASHTGTDHGSREAVGIVTVPATHRIYQRASDVHEPTPAEQRAHKGRMCNRAEGE